MGDIYQFTTWPKQNNMFFKFTSHAINFEIKAVENACVLLSRTTEGPGDYLIVIGHHNTSQIKCLPLSGEEVSKDTPDILSGDEYRKFWVTWYGNLICLGREGETEPVVELNAINTSSVKFVSFSMIDYERHPAHWKIELPPHLEKPVMKAVPGGDLYWVKVDADTQFPDEACIGGYENENLYIIQAEHEGSTTPGKFVSSEGLGYIPWGGEANVKNSFHVLCGFNFTWVPSTLDNIPVGAVVAGHSEDGMHEKLYIGRGRHLNHIIPGKVQPTHKTCYIPYEGNEIALQHYEIMVVPEKARCANMIMENMIMKMIMSLWIMTIIKIHKIKLDTLN